MGKCKICGTELSQGAKFCPECGTKVPQVLICPQCGMEVPVESKFCMNCGASMQGKNTGTLFSGDANAISAHDIVNGNQEIVHGNKDVVSGDKIVAQNYTINNNIQPEVYGASEVNVEKLLEKAIDYYDDENYYKAIGLFRQLSDIDAQAQYYMGLCYKEGNGTKIDIEKAKEWFEKSINGGYPSAYSAVADLYVDDRYGMMDFAKAKRYYEIAAEHGDNDGKGNLAEIYAVGYNVKQDWKKANDYLTSVDEDEYHIASFLKAIMYAEGHIVARNPNKVFHLLDSFGFEDFEKDMFSEYPIYSCQIIEHAINIYGDLLLEKSATCNQDSERDRYRAWAIEKYKLAIDLFDSEDARKRLASLSDSDFQLSPDRKTLIKCTNDNVQSLIIPQSVEEIGDMAFFEKTNLKKVTLPSSLRTIGVSAFQNSGLCGICIPEGCKTIDNSAFYGCENLKEVTLPESISVIEEEAFACCQNLTSIRIPGNVTTLNNVFGGCTNLSRVDIPDSVTEIGYCAFWKCQSLTQISIPGSCKKIGKSSFKYCESLREIHLSEGLTSIDEDAFAFCYQLHEIALPSSLKRIDRSAFSSRIKKVIIDDKFSDDIDLKEIFGDEIEICIKQKTDDKSLEPLDNGSPMLNQTGKEQNETKKSNWLKRLFH